MNSLTTYPVPLLPYLQRREEHEIARASRARSRTKVKSIPKRFATVNHMYPVNRRTGGKYLSDEGRIYKEYIQDVLTDTGIIPPPFENYECGYVFFMSHDMLYTKHQELQEIDVSNMLKAAEDALFEFLMENDCLVASIHGYKRLTLAEPKLVVLLTEGDCTGPVYFAGQAFDTAALEACTAMEGIGGGLLPGSVR